MRPQPSYHLVAASASRRRAHYNTERTVRYMRILGKVLVGGVLLTSFLFTLRFLGSTQQPDASRILDQLDVCINQSHADTIVTPAEERCARTVLAGYLMSAESMETFLAVRDNYLTHTNLARYCHTLDHYTGSVLAEKFDVDVIELGRIAVDECSTGLLHGYMETLGRNNPSPAEVRAVISACETLPERQMHSCADGVGHLLYVQTPDLFRTAAQCAEFNDPAGNIVCSYGVLMAAYGIFPTGEETDFRDLSSDLMPQLCAQWPSPGTLGQYGCGAGLGLMLTVDDNLAALSRKITHQSTADDATAISTETDRKLDHLYGMCTELHSAASRLGCLSEVVRQLRVRPNSVTNSYETICSRIPEGYQDVCLLERYGPSFLYTKGAHNKVPPRFGQEQQ
jgi:hypothetical protein